MCLQLSLSMGVDCPNILEVFHWGVPRSLEDYYRECGRAGRDGLASKSYTVIILCFLPAM